jgi:hypothetical protein
MGCGPRLTWEILSADETGTAISFERERDAREWFSSHTYLHDQYHVGTWKHWPSYSTDIAAAMQVVERFTEWTMFKTSADDPLAYDVQVTRDDSRVFTGTSSALPEAICRAALAAVEAQERQDRRGEYGVDFC